MPNRAAALFERARDCANKPAIVFEDTCITFGQLAGRVEAMAGALRALGVRRGVHAGILLPASPDFVVVEQALFMLGAPLTPVNVLYRAAEVAHAVACCDLRVLITTEALAAGLGDKAMPDGCEVLLIDSPSTAGHTRPVALAMGSSEPVRKPEDLPADAPAMLLLTSATTGKAKGVMLTLANLAANYDRSPEWLGIDRDDTILCALPLYNTFGLNQCINAILVTGATMVLLPRFDAARCVEAIARHRCTFLPAVPTMLQKIFDRPEATPVSLASLERIMTGGAPVPSALLKRILAAAPDVTVLTGYGLTEATALVTLTEVSLDEAGNLRRGNTIGRVLDGMQLAIVDDEGAPCETGTSGEIVIAGPNLMAGYYKAPADTAEALRDGWLRTGDIGTIDAEGYAFIVDRKKDVIIRGGQNIYPIDIEEVLYQAVGVAEAAVVARYDDVMGEVPVAYVAPSPGHTLNPDALLEHCREHLARYKVPASLTVLSDLPKGPTGKILRRALRDGTVETA